MRAEIKLFAIDIGIDNLIAPPQGTSKSIIKADDEKAEVRIYLGDVNRP